MALNAQEQNSWFASVQNTVLYRAIPKEVITSPVYFRTVFSIILRHITWRHHWIPPAVFLNQSNNNNNTNKKQWCSDTGTNHNDLQFSFGPQVWTARSAVQIHNVVWLLEWRCHSAQWYNVFVNPVCFHFIVVWLLEPQCHSAQCVCKSHLFSLHCGVTFSVAMPLSSMI